MTKDEARLAVMGAISMALKDPTLQQGFEIICKNLLELEKGNAELKAFINAPHTKGRKTTRADYIKTVWDLSKKLSEAKELLREFVEWANWQGNSKCPSFKNIQDKAEEFLKED